MVMEDTCSSEQLEPQKARKEFSLLHVYIGSLFELAIKRIRILTEVVKKLKCYFTVLSLTDHHT